MILQSLLHANPYQQPATSVEYADLCRNGISEVLGVQCPASIDPVGIELSTYDMKIPPSSVTPFDVFQPKGIHPLFGTYVMLFTIDPYEQPTTIPPSVIEQIYGNKNDPYLPLSRNCDRIELGWLGFYIIDGVMCIHHNQVNGVISQNPALRKITDKMYTFQLEVVSEIYGHQMIMPTSNTMNRCFAKTQDVVAVPTRAYSTRVMRHTNWNQCTLGDIKLPTSNFEWLTEQDMTLWTKK
jgi:hypothetical protein